MTNLLEPWVLLRLAAGLVAASMFVRGASTARRVLRHFDVARATEGQLALEKQLELSRTFARVGAVAQALSLALGVLAADRLSRAVRGAMCAFGVFAAHDWGFRSLAVTTFVALSAGTLAQVFAFDTRVRTLELARPLAWATCAMAPLAVLDLVVTAKFLLGLDLSVVASCCSVQLDTGGAAVETHSVGPRALVTLVAVALAALAIGAAAAAYRAPTRPRVVAAGMASLGALVPALAAVVLEVAPHAFEVPTHTCPFCLLKPEVLVLGYPLFAALFLAVSWASGTAASALLASAPSAAAELPGFARPRLRRVAFAWLGVLVLAASPVIRFAVVTDGASLFAAESASR